MNYMKLELLVLLSSHFGRRDAKEDMSRVFNEKVTSIKKNPNPILEGIYYLFKREIALCYFSSHSYKISSSNKNDCMSIFINKN